MLFDVEFLGRLGLPIRSLLSATLRRGLRRQALVRTDAGVTAYAVFRSVRRRQQEPRFRGKRLVSDVCVTLSLHSSRRGGAIGPGLVAAPLLLCFPGAETGTCSLLEWYDELASSGGAAPLCCSRRHGVAAGGARCRGRRHAPAQTRGSRGAPALPPQHRGQPAAPDGQRPRATGAQHGPRGDQRPGPGGRPARTGASPAQRSAPAHIAPEAERAGLPQLDGPKDVAAFFGLKSVKALEHLTRPGSAEGAPLRRP